jgi:hypothetical protein
MAVTDTLWNEPSYWSEAAEQAFGKARRRARTEALINRLRGRRSTLVSFDEIAEQSGRLPESTEARQAVPISHIVGSVGKSRFFTRSFLPMDDRLRRRWKRAFAVAHGLRGYQPIELYEVEGRFFVVDGHFRVSVARVLGYKTIQARVRRWR